MEPQKYTYPGDPPPPPPSITYQHLPPPPAYSGPTDLPPPPPPPGIMPIPTQIVNVVTTEFGPYPQNTICPTCNQTVTTLTQQKTGISAWLASACCCALGLVCGCCLIPFYTDATLDVEHSCPRCGRKLGLYRRI